MKHADALSRYPICLIIAATTVRIKKAQDEDDYKKALKKILKKELSRLYFTEGYNL